MKKVYLIAFFAALIAGCATYLFAQSFMEKTQVTIKDKQSTAVYIAKEDVPIGTRIDQRATAEQLFEERAVPIDYVTNGAVTDLNTILGKITTREIFPGDQVSEHAFVEEAHSKVDLSYTVEKGYVAYSIAAESVKGVDGYIRVGDTIDVLAKYQPIEQAITTDGEVVTKEAGEPIYEYEFQGLKVVKIGNYEQSSQVENGDVKTYSSITLQVDKEDAKKLFEMEDKTGGGVKYVLNHRDAEAEEETTAKK